MITTITTTTKRRYEFTRDIVINALVTAGYLPSMTCVKDIHVRVPGGGDWSNMDLDLNDHPVVVVTEETKESQS